MLVEASLQLQRFEIVEWMYYICNMIILAGQHLPNSQAYMIMFIGALSNDKTLSQCS